jgi:hypothetical protein
MSSLVAVIKRSAEREAMTRHTAPTMNPTEYPWIWAACTLAMV